MTENGIELYKKYRPTKFSELVGQDEAVRMLVDLGKRNNIPHAILLTGPSGCGKSTTARILRTKLNCSKMDYTEINAADFRGIDTVREIRQRMGLAPIAGNCRIYVMDEGHSLVSLAQDSLLKLLEDTPQHVYFILCTTDPQKLKTTIRTRCTEIKFKNLNEQDSAKLVRNIAAKENIKLSDEVVKKLVDIAEGSARKLLVLLHAIAGMTIVEEQLAAIQDAAHERQGIELARLLIYPGGSFAKAAAIIKELNEEPETVRWIVLTYARKVLLDGGKLAPRAYDVINAFRDNFYDSKLAGLAAACYESFLK